MSEPEEHPESRDPGDDTVGRLLRLAGPPPEVPAVVTARARAAARASWRARVEARQARTRRWALGGLAAAAALAFLAFGLLGGWPGTGTPVARVDFASGDIGLAVGDELAAGGTVETPPGARLALVLGDGTSLRLDGGSRLRLEEAGRVSLDRGALYADSGSSGAGLEVATPLGLVRDVGTRFAVRLLAEGESTTALRVRVRDGKVLIEAANAAEPAEAGAGEELTLAGDGSLARAAAEVHGDAWSWVMEAAPPFAAEGRRLTELLAWVERETGWRVRYADPSLAGIAEDTVLHGSAPVTDPRTAPALLLPAAGLGHRLEGGVLTVVHGGP